MGPSFYSCSTSTSSMPAVLLYLSAAIPFLYSSSLNADTNEGIPSILCSTGRFGFVGIIHPMCDLVGVDQTGRVSLDSFLIDYHAL